MHVFTRALRSREHGALLVPVVVDAAVYRFDLLDCMCEIAYDPALFASFPRVRSRTAATSATRGWCRATRCANSPTNHTSSTG